MALNHIVYTERDVRSFLRYISSRPTRFADERLHSRPSVAGREAFMDRWTAVTALVLCSLVVTPPCLDARQTSFKVYISADMEGVAGLVSDDQVGAEGAEYPLGRRLMTAEVNAAVTAAFEAGATTKEHNTRAVTAVQRSEGIPHYTGRR